jgi:hypothetical protein
VLDTKSPKYLEMAQGHISLSRFLSDAPRRLHYRVPAKNAADLIPFGNCGDRDTNSVVTVSQDSRPTRYNYNDSRKSRGVVWFF